MENYRFHAPFKSPAAIASVALAALLTGCAAAPQPQEAVNPRDPWEGYNREMTKFNDAVDKAVLKPVATAYTKAVPSPVRTGVSNFFGNIGDTWSFVNNLLEADVQGALYSFWRVAVNTTFGLGGILDPATQMRLDRHRKDFGLTLGRWGMPPGPYLVLPILGPSTLRDTLALPVDVWGNLANHIQNVPARNSLFVLSVINTRAQLLGATNLLDQAALDPYSFTRDAWLQKRRNDVYDGNPPPEDDDGSQNAARYDRPSGGDITPPITAPASPASSASAPQSSL
ncbi:MAG: VacJ family lipoprotein [Burkholderiaceae bacterium]|nr:VacJ family lipoprotein [Burkholderiaceae bacterium]